MNTKNYEGASKFTRAFMSMSEQSVAEIVWSEASNDSGAIYQIQNIHTAEHATADRLWLRQGYGRGPNAGKLNFEFTLAGRAIVDESFNLEGYVSASKLSKLRGGNALRGIVMPQNTEELDRLIKYFQKICPQISRRIYPQWHGRENNP